MKIPLKLFFVIASLSLGATEGFRLWWFSQTRTGKDIITNLEWTPPENAIDQNFSEKAGVGILNHDKGLQVVIERPNDNLTVEVIYLDYKSGNRGVLNDLISHTPENCFPNFGARLIQEFKPQTLSVTNQEVLVRQWLFENPRSKADFYVFKIIWSPEFNFLKENFRHGSTTLLGLDSTLRRIRLSAARQGLDAPATRMILALVRGTSDHSEAWQAFKEATIDRLSKPE